MVAQFTSVFILRQQIWSNMDIIAALLALIIPFLFSGGGNGRNNQLNPNNSRGGEAPPASVAQAPPKSIPTPALLPGLIGLGLGALRKRKSEEVETEA